MRSSSRYTLFSPANSRHTNDKHRIDTASYRELLQRLDLFAEANHKYLLLKHRFDIIRKTKLLAPFYRAKAKGNTSRFENYLKNFIHDFEHDPKLQPTIVLYKTLLLTYQNTKTVLSELNANARQQPSNSIESLVAALKPAFNPELELHREWLNQFNVLAKPSEELEIEETPNEALTLTNQQIALEQLQTAFMHCINLRVVKNNAPHHRALLLQNYYPAKLSILLHNYEKQYGQVNRATLIASTTQAVREEQEQTIRADYLDARNELEKQKTEFNEPRYQREQNKLQLERENQLDKINNAAPQLTAHATEFITLAADRTQMRPVFGAAIEEVARNRITLRGGPALFNALKPGTRRNYEQTFATPLKADDPATMSEFAELFRQQCATLSTEGQAAPAA